MQFGIVSPDHLPYVWDSCLPIIAKACNYNGNFDSPQHIYGHLENQRKFLWLAALGKEIQGLILTSIETFPNKKACSIDICTGVGIDSWIENLSIIEKWARECGCHEMFFMARIGYERKLKNFKYKKSHIFLQKDLLNE